MELKAFLVNPTILRFSIKVSFLQTFILTPVTAVGEFMLFVFETLASFRKLWKRRGLLLRQCEFIGVSSLPIILVSGAFLGAVLGYQLYVSFKLFGAQSLLGGSIGVALLRELGPVMAAIMVTGRAGAAIAAQISSMKITEQVDALEVMAVSPVEYLVAPRVLAGVMMMPILSLIFSVVATFSGKLVACEVMGLDPSVFWNHFEYVVDVLDLFHCTVKSVCFGFAITALACFYGVRAYGGAGAVGLATRTTVVASCLSILFLDYILTTMLPFDWTKLVVTG